MKKLLIFASGDKVGGGSGFQKLVESVRDGSLNADIVGVVSNNAEGGVWKRAQELGIPFFHFPGPYTAENYQSYVAKTRADFIALSGWLKLVTGLPPERTMNIHPGPLPRFGGKGMYGHHVHEAVMEAFRRGEVFYSEVCMHFVTKEFDKGPVFFRCLVDISSDETPETLAKRVNEAEHKYQSYFTSLVVNGKIYWDGKDPGTLVGDMEWDFRSRL
ncbi:MAG: formyltransferase family protein [Candidatus Paceibacterota bacterium]|jgi:phosphoribosylglycinamide formyltransferase-1